MAVKGGIRALRKRIRAVQNIKKITKAMKMVSSVRLRKAQVVLGTSRGYLDELSEKLSVDIEGKVGDEVYRFVIPRSEGKKRLIMVLTSDRGLCGAFNSNVVRLARANITENDIIWAFGRKGARALSKTFKVREFENFWRNFSPDEVGKVVQEIENEVKNGVSEVWAIYTYFKSAGTQIPQVEKVYPFDVVEFWGVKTIYEPSREEIFKYFARLYLKAKLFRIFMESLTSEHAYRMRAMDMATQNAEEYIKKLTLQLNKARQEAITKELIDIVNGKNALEAESV